METLFTTVLFKEAPVDAPEIISKNQHAYLTLLSDPEAYARLDEKDDALFYRKPRMVEHLDSLALTTIETLIGVLGQYENPEILDLMASFNSHLPEDLRPSGVTGLGLNMEELKKNPVLTERVVHDINENPRLPFESKRFDIVLNVSSIQYVVNPVNLFREVGRVLKPGGLFLVVFSNRMFPTKAVRSWERAQDDERLKIVETHFLRSGEFDETETFASIGKPRPQDDKYAGYGIPSDPVFAVYALKRDSDGPGMKLPPITLDYEEALDPEELKRRTRAIGETGCCPYCGEPLKEWAITDNPYTTWTTNLKVCVNDACPYVVRGWDVMFRQGNLGTSYRLTYNPETGRAVPVPVPNLNVIKNELVE